MTKEPWERPWRTDVKITQGKIYKRNDDGNYQAQIGPGAEIKVWIPIEDITKFELYFRSIHKSSVFTLEDLCSKIQDAAGYFANDCERWAQDDNLRNQTLTANREPERPTQEPAERYYEPSDQDAEMEWGSDR